MDSLDAQDYRAPKAHFFLSQPAKGSLQLNTEKQHSQANTHQSHEHLGAEGRRKEKEGEEPPEPQPQSPLPLATLAPHKPLGLK